MKTNDKKFPADSERKKGHWRPIPMACYGGGTITEYVCSECGERSLLKNQICMNCGSYNGDIK